LDTATALERIIRPKSVVVIGANESVGTMPSAPVRNLLRHRYPGRVAVVNPRRGTVFGVPSYPSVDRLPDVPDTAVLVVGAARVPDALRDCAAHGIRTATVIAAGFDEGAAATAQIGPGGGAGAELRRVLDETGIRILGPNTAGLLNLADSYVPRGSLNHPEPLPTGRVGIVTQSGGLCNILLNRAAANQVGVGLAVACGNQLDLTLWDVADHALHDPGIDVLLTVVEGFKHPHRFVEVARRARELGKPLAVLKLGASEAGAKMVETHSGALAGSADVHRAVFDELNVIAADDLDQLWEVAALVSAWGPPAGGIDRLGVVTLSGGDGAIIADEVSRLGMSLPPPSAAIVDATAREFPGVHVDNPFDSQAATAVTGAASWPAQIALVAADPGFDAVLLSLPVLATPDSVPVIPPHLSGLAGSRCARAAVSMWTAGEATEPAMRLLREAGLPVFETSVRALRAIHAYGRYGAGRSVPLPPGGLRGVPARPGSTAVPVPYWTARERLAALGVPVNRAALVHTVEQARAAAKELGYPVTVKLSATSVAHKAAGGGLFLYLRDATQVAAAATSLLQWTPAFGPGEGVVVEEHEHGVLAAFVGGHRDPEFGPFVLAGLGGGLAEPYADIGRASCPARPDRVDTVLAATTFGRVLARDAPAHRALRDLLVTLSEAFAADEGVVSFDLNPMLVRADGSLVAVDARAEYSMEAP
jgi:acyl-CoA synthetase (NDP forming)